MHVDIPITASTATAPAPPDSMAAQAAALDEIMAQAAIGANAQRDEEAGIPLPASPERHEATSPDGAQDDDDEQEGEDEDDAGAQGEPAAPPAAQEPTSAQPTTPTEPIKYSRRDAARFAEAAQKAEREATEAREIAARAQAELNAARAQDQHVLTQLADISGFNREANGRTRYENLSDKVLKGTATDAERTLVAEMTQWHDLAKPIYRAAEQQVTRAFSTDWKALKDLKGVGDDGLAKLNQAANGVAASRELHSMAYAAGQADGKAEAEQTIARLRAQLKSAKTSAVAGAPQPAVANGAAVPAGAGSFRERAFLPNGEINEDFDREVRAGKWLGVNLSET